MATIENNTPKQQMLAILHNQPDDSSFSELLRELACRCAVKRGLEDVDQGRTVSNEEALQRIKSWQS